MDKLESKDEINASWRVYLYDKDGIVTETIVDGNPIKGNTKVRKSNYNVVRVSKTLARELVKEVVNQTPAALPFPKAEVDRVAKQLYNRLRRQATADKVG